MQIGELSPKISKLTAHGSAEPGSLNNDPWYIKFIHENICIYIYIYFYV